jgi:hypothetical protein
MNTVRAGIKVIFNPFPEPRVRCETFFYGWFGFALPKAKGGTSKPKWGLAEDYGTCAPNHPAGYAAFSSYISTYLEISLIPLAFALYAFEPRLLSTSHLL